MQLIDATTNVDRYNQISEHLSDFNFFKAYIIRIYAQLILISQSKIERKDIDDEIVDRLSTAVQNSAESGIGKTYSEVAHSSVKNGLGSTGGRKRNSLQHRGVWPARNREREAV